MDRLGIVVHNPVKISEGPAVQQERTRREGMIAICSALSLQLQSSRRTCG